MGVGGAAAPAAPEEEEEEELLLESQSIRVPAVQFGEERIYFTQGSQGRHSRQELKQRP